MKNKVSIILYHNPESDVLERHLNFFSKRYNFITLDLLVDSIYSKSWEQIPPKSLIITFDDGNKENYKLIEIFKKYKVKPTIYICTQIVNTNRKFWYRVYSKKSERLKKLTNVKRLQLLSETATFTMTKEYPEEARQALSNNEMMLMKDFVDFQSHTCFHPILTTCADEECKKEIIESKKDIEVLLNKDCRHFSYPNGDYTEREVKLVENAGYLSARTIDVGWNDLNSNPYKLKITGVADDASINWLSVQLSGISGYLKYLPRGNCKGKHPTIIQIE